ncbi:hypothetical protein [Streptomyces formicae]|uniref:Integral membrane protein n=1 Tax=Streptomyces formicae TaxID=1616117 RepID=A0ABY3WQR4_9ACTN|nr:hypothetical protein [Streptomyces formicae]UNM14983.1 hypothetical protein J4032_29090 [Streptomyces formicae]
MLDGIRRGLPQLPSGQIHGTSFNFATVEPHSLITGHAMVRLSAILASATTAWVVATDAVIDSAQSALIATMIGFSWNAGFQFSWFRRR